MNLRTPTMSGGDCTAKKDGDARDAFSGFKKRLW